MSARPPVPHADLADALLAELGWVRRLARRLVGDGADDLTQEVAVATLEARPPRGRLRAWLGAVVRKRAARWHRDARRRSAIEGAAPTAPGEDEPDRVVERLHRQRELVDAVLTLPEPYRAVIVARFFDDLGPAEIARRRNVAPATVRQQLSRGLAMLRARLQSAHGDGWRRGLIVLLPGAGAVVPTTVGAFVMSKKLLTAAAALCVALGVAWALRGSGDGDAGSATPIAAPGRVAAADSERSTAGPDDAAADRVPVPGDPRATTLALRIVTESGAAIDAASVFLLVDHDVRQGKTDGDGRVAFESSDAPGTVLVVPGNRPPQRFDLPALRGEHTLSLPDGVAVAGRVRVLGDRPPVAPMPVLELSPSGFDAGPLPAELVERAGDDTLANLRSAIAADGTFAFHGLPQDWTGRVGLGFRAPYWLRAEDDPFPAGEPRSVRLAAPQTHLRLVLAPMPTVTGRVVWEDGAPVDRPQVTVSVVFDGGVGGTSWTGAAPRADGRFVVGLVPRDTSLLPSWLNPRNQAGIREVQLTCRSPRALRTESRTYGAAELAPGNDIGDVVLRRAPVTHVLVCAPDGTPVPEALVEGGSGRRTDGGGRVAIGAERAAARTRRIGAPGFEVGEYVADRGSGTETEPFRFTLRPGNRLTLRVSRSTLPLDRVWLEVQTFEPMYLGSDEGVFVYPTAYHVAAGGTRSLSGGRSQTPPVSADARFSLDTGGRVELVSLRPGVVLHLRVFDPLRHVALERDLRAPAIGDHQTVRLCVDGAVSVVRGTVLLAGRPLEGAELELFAGEGWDYVKSAADGGFECTFLAAPARVGLEVRHPDAVVQWANLQLTPGTEELRFDLQPAHSVTVRVVDLDGAPVDSEVALRAEKPLPPRGDIEIGTMLDRLGAGHRRRRGLPAGAYRACVDLSGQTFEQPFALPAAGDVVLRIPEPVHQLDLELPAELPFEQFTLRITGAGGRVSETRMSRIHGVWRPRALSLLSGTYAVKAIRAGEPPWTTTWTVPMADGRRTVSVFR